MQCYSGHPLVLAYVVLLIWPSSSAGIYSANLAVLLGHGCAHEAHEQRVLQSLRENANPLSAIGTEVTAAR